jgi:hypothetical protein
VRRLLLLAGASLVAATVTPAAASATNNPHALPFTLTCGANQVMVLSPSPHAASGEVLTSRGEAIAYLITETENGTTTVIFQLGQGQRTGQPGQTTACTSPAPDGGTWDWSVLFRPAG